MMSAEEYTERARVQLLRRAARRVITTQLGSARSLARWFDIPLQRAEEMLDDLERAGIVGPADVGPSRTVLHTADQAGAAIDRLIPKPPAPEPLTHSAAAELLRSYAPGGTSLERALAYAEQQETRPGRRDRVRAAAQLLGLRP